MELLPLEIKLKIIELLKIRNILALARTNKGYLKLCQSDLVWKPLLRSRFNIEGNQAYLTYKILYQNLNVYTVVITDVMVDDVRVFKSLSLVIDYIIKSLASKGYLYKPDINDNPYSEKLHEYVRYHKASPTDSLKDELDHYLRIAKTGLNGTLADLGEYEGISFSFMPYDIKIGVSYNPIEYH